MTLSWFGICRLGLVQMALGSIVVLTTATMNRVMTVELAMPAVLPGLLVALYYATQSLRPKFGHGADQGGRRTPWIIGGIVCLAAGAMGAAGSVWLMGSNATLGIAAAVPSFVLIGLGIGAAGTNLLALLAARVHEDRQAAAGSAVWIMMIFGLAVTGITAGILLDPYTPERLIAVTAGACVIAVLLTLAGVLGQERGPMRAPPKRKLSFREVLAEMATDPKIRAFTLFVFASMLAYNLQDLILEPFARRTRGYAHGAFRWNGAGTLDHRPTSGLDRWRLRRLWPVARCPRLWSTFRTRLADHRQCLHAWLRQRRVRSGRHRRDDGHSTRRQ